MFKMRGGVFKDGKQILSFPTCGEAMRRMRIAYINKDNIEKLRVKPVHPSKEWGNA